MNGLLLAIIGHLLNAVAFVVDKTLLGTAFKRSATYAAMISTLPLVVVIAIPWVRVWPSGVVWLTTFAFGSLFFFALWCFFEALRRAETSRVVPIIGSLIPLFTLVGTATFLGERLGTRQLAGFGVLLVATFLLTRTFGSKKNGLALSTILIACCSAVLFAASSVFGKFTYDHLPFLTAFVTSRIAAGLTGIAVGLCLPSVRKEVASLLRPKKSGGSLRTTALAFVGQACGGVGFVLIHLAISTGSASIVNALQAVQYAAIVLVAWFGGERLRRALKEEKTPKIMLVKSAAIVLVGVGLFFIA